MTWVLGEDEQIRYRALGADTAAALEEAIRAAQPGESEWQIASRLDAACRKRGGLAIVNLVATDDRIAQFRHPYITDKPLDKLVMMVVCMRRGGLVAAGTRIAYFGALPDALRDKQDKVAAIDAAGMSATRPGRTLGDVFAALQAAYTSQGEGDQWKLHHQGGMIGYASREHIATPGDPTVIEAGQAFAWNPSIVGCKSEDTILLGVDGFEIVTQASEDWPSIEVGIGGQTIRRPAILELPVARGARWMPRPRCTITPVFLLAIAGQRFVMNSSNCALWLAGNIPNICFICALYSPRVHAGLSQSLIGRSRELRLTHRS